MKSLSYQQRMAIAQGIRDGKSNAQIARELQVHRSTVGREISRNAASRNAYEAEEADTQSWQRKQDAARGYRPFQFGGLPYFTILSKHDRLYTFFSRTHLCYSRFHTSLFPTPWNPLYIRLHEKWQFTPDSIYARFRWLSQGIAKVHSEQPAKADLSLLSKMRMPWQTTWMPHPEPEKRENSLDKFHIGHQSMVKQGVRKVKKLTIYSKNISNSIHISPPVRTGFCSPVSVKSVYRSIYRQRNVFPSFIQSDFSSINCHTE